MASIPASPSPASAEPMLIPQGDYAGKPPLRLQKSVVVVGADEHCHLHLISSSVSRHHALIIHDQDGVYIRDLGSRTKVVVNGQPHRETLLANEDEIHIGKFSFRFSLASPANDSPAPPPGIRIKVNGKPAPIQSAARTLLIGKGEGCDVSLSDNSVSSRHAIIFTAKGKRYVRDLDSRIGTFLDGEKIHQQEFHPGTELRIGDTVIGLMETAKPAEVIEAPHFEPPVAELETKPEPAAQAPAHSGDTLPLALETAPEPAEQSPDTQELLKLEPEPETEADALESALADAAIDLKKDSVPIEPEPAQTPEAPEPLKLELEPETSTDALESALADAEIDLKKDAIPVEPETETRAEEATTPELTEEPAAKIELPTSPEEPAQPALDLSDITLDLEPEPAAEPAAADPPLETARTVPPPVTPVIEVSNPAESALDLNFDLNLDLDSVEKIEAMEPPLIEHPEPFQPKIELTSMELASDEPLNPQQDAAGEAPNQELTADAVPADASELPPEKPRKRPARGRKAAPANETKTPKAPRAKTKRRAPKSVELTEPTEPNVEPDLAPSSAQEIFAEEIPAAFIPDEPVTIAPAISVQPVVPVTPPTSDELPAHVWDEPSEATQEESSPVISDEYRDEPPAGVPVATDMPEASPDGDVPPAGDWSIPASATEEISEPIISEDQTTQQPSLTVEPSLPEAPLISDDLTGGDWAIPPAPSEEISAPIVTDPSISVPSSGGPPSPPPPARQPAAVFESPLTSLGGFGFVGGGTVNLDHFLGGMPINLPELPPTPAGFGRIRIDMTGKPSQVRMTAPPPPQPPPVQAPPSPPPPPPVAVAAPQPSAPPPAPPIIQPPPVSFTPRPPAKPAAAENVYHPLDQSFPEKHPPTSPSKPSNAFDGLAMGAALDTDIFSGMASNPTPISDAAFGGAALSPPDDYAIPESPERAKRSAETPEPDFANDEFWNRTDEQDDAAATAAKRPETPLPPPTREELHDLHNDLPNEEPGDTQSDAVLPPKATPESPPPAKRRFRIPFLMPLILIGVGVAGALAAIWRFIPVQSQINGTMTFLNFSFIPGTQESIDFEAAQRRLLDDQTRTRASEILARDYPGIGQGFLKTPELFDQVAASVSLNSSAQSVSPQTLLLMSTPSSDKDGDRLRMLALLQSLSDRNAPQLDSNRRLRQELQHAQQNVDDTQQKLDKIKNQLSALTPIIDAAPPGDQLESLTAKKNILERAQLEAEAAVTRDHADLQRLATAPAADTQPAVADPQLKQLRQQLADLSAEVDSARSDQLAGAAMARQNLQVASRKFDEQIAAANTLLGGESQLRQFVDSAMDSQVKARDLINMLIVDGEDLELQLEDTRRDVEDLIQTQQADKWALDPQLQSLRENLDSAQHRFNANSGQGITDPRILDPLQKEIDNWTTQVKQRQAELGADPGEIRVQESLDSIIDALRKKLTKEKHQTDQVLDPLQKQLADLDPQVSGLPAAQQELARQIHQRLDALNDARQKFADSFGDEQLAPSAKVAELKNRIADLKADIAARQADIEHAAIAARDAQHSGDLATIQARLSTDQANFAKTSKDLEAGLNAYDDVHAKQLAADAAQQKKMNLLDDQRTAFADLETARRDRDEKQSAADHAFDIAPVSATDVIATAPPDPRMMYSLTVMGGGLVAVALAALASHAGPRRTRKKSAPPIAADFDSLVIPMATDDDHPATA